MIEMHGKTFDYDNSPELNSDTEVDKLSDRVKKATPSSTEDLYADPDKALRDKKLRGELQEQDSRKGYVTLRINNAALDIQDADEAIIAEADKLGIEVPDHIRNPEPTLDERVAEASKPKVKKKKASSIVEPPEDDETVTYKSADDIMAMSDEDATNYWYTNAEYNERYTDDDKFRILTKLNDPDAEIYAPEADEE